MLYRKTIHDDNIPVGLGEVAWLYNFSYIVSEIHFKSPELVEKEVGARVVLV